MTQTLLYLKGEHKEVNAKTILKHEAKPIPLCVLVVTTPAQVGYSLYMLNKYSGHRDIPMTPGYSRVEFNKFAPTWV